MNRELVPQHYIAEPKAFAPPPPPDGQDQFFDLGEILVSLWRRKLPILAAALAAAALAGAVLLNVPSVYTARAKVQLLRTDRQVIDIQNVVQTSGFGDSDVLSEMAIIQSAPILLRVVRRLDLAQHEEFQAQPSALGLLLAPLRALLGRGGADGGAPDPEAVATGLLADRVSVRQDGLSFILSVDVTSADPGRAAEIANAIVAEYMAQQVEYKLDATNQATAWLEGRVRDLLSRLDEAEAAVETARAEIAKDGVPTTDIITQQIQDLSDLLVAGRIAHADALTRKREFDLLIARGQYVAAAQIVESPTLRDSGERLSAIRRQIETLGVRPPEDDLLRRLTASRDELEGALMVTARDISAGLQGAVDVAAGRLKSLQDASLQLEVLLTDQSAETRELRVRERRLDTIQNVYQTFLTRLTETRERGSFQEPNARVVTSASPPPAPSSPRRAALVMVAFVLSAAAASAVALVLDMRADAIKTTAQLSRLTGAPVLAALPRKARSWADAASSARALYVSTAMQLPPGPGRAVVVASSVPDERSGEVARVLAEQAAAAGCRVALIAVGARAPAAPKGCSLLLFEDLLRDSGGGATAASIAGVLGSARAGHDLIVLDAPPLLAEPEGFLLVQEADGLVLAVRWNSTPRGAVRSTLAQMSWLKLRLMGAVLTDVDPGVAASYGYPGEGLVRRLLRQRPASAAA